MKLDLEDIKQKFLNGTDINKNMRLKRKWK